MKTKHAQMEEILIIIFNILISYLRPVLVHTFISKIIWKCRRGSQVASDGNDNDLIKLLRTANILGAVISCLHDNSDQNSGLAPVLNFKASWTCLVLDLCPLWPPVHLWVSSIFYRGARPVANSWDDIWGVRSQKDFYKPLLINLNNSELVSSPPCLLNRCEGGYVAVMALCLVPFKKPWEMGHRKKVCVSNSWVIMIVISNGNADFYTTKDKITFYCT